MAQIVWTAPALEELNAIAECIALDKPEAAAGLVRRIFAHVEKLVDFPVLGPRVPELLPGSRYRQIVEPPCRVFYRYDAKSAKCYVLNVMRGEKLFQKRLLRQRDKETKQE
jgi:plasmid stabilization system protein ParE